MITIEDVKFDIYIPLDVEGSIEKTDNQKDSDGNWYVRGYASTPNRDLQGEIVIPQGIDIDYFVKSG